MNVPIRILVVEDEYITSQDIRDNLIEMGYSISGAAKDANEACLILDKKETDFVILDINLQGKKDGIWIANEINEKHNIPFIFLTSFGDERTVKSAIETKPFGYLVKPFERVDIFTSIEVALKNFAQINVTPTELSVEINKQPLSIDDFIFTRDKHLYCKVNLREVLYISTELKFVEIHTESKIFRMRYNLNEFFETLPKDHFFQIHRSFVVNKAAVEKVGANFVVIRGEELPMSGSRRSLFLENFNFY
jgi:DNA-binding LytR/AlgR family response regulator